MTDDLVKRLRDERHITQRQGLEALLNTTNAAADRIEELENVIQIKDNHIRKLERFISWQSAREDSKDG